MCLCTCKGSSQDFSHSYGHGHVLGIQQSDTTGPISQLFFLASPFVFLILGCLCGHAANGQKSLQCQDRAILLQPSPTPTPPRQQIVHCPQGLNSTRAGREQMTTSLLCPLPYFFIFRTCVTNLLSHSARTRSLVLVVGSPYVHAVSVSWSSPLRVP